MSKQKKQPAAGGERDDGKLTFEQALAKLEGLVEQIESGEVPLEASIDKYAEGITLIRQCRGILDQAEKKIQLLAAGEGETLTPDGELDEPDTGDDDADAPGE
ncbi:MAG: exodeoxyribonuclease VII small subunit [Phycisphaerae bacterium]|nr:exodeoxyribonuclease VII small subunit [Phycisphaerae bacterium]